MKRCCHRFFIVLAVLAVICFAGGGVSLAATINIVNLDGPSEGFNDPTPAPPVGGNTGLTIGQQRLMVFQRAAEIWGRALVSTVPIRVAARFDPLSCTAGQGILGSAGPVTVIRDFAGAPLPATYYTIALANAIAGEDLDPDDDDIDARFNSDLGQADCLANTSWYYGLDNGTPPNAINLLETILHEFGHGLGFVSLVNLTTGSKFNGFNDAFMRHLEDHTSGKTYPQMTDTERRVANTATGDLHWIGTNVVARSGILSAGRHSAGHVEMFAPDPVESGSSVSHFSTSLVPDELMEPYATATVDLRLSFELLKDVGWTVIGEGPALVANGASVILESCGPPNGAIDAAELVSVNFSLRNLGAVAATNVVATLLPGGGVTLPSSPQVYGALLPNGPAVGRAFSFVANSGCGDTLTATLQLQDGTNNLESIPFVFNIGRKYSFTNATAIDLPLSGVGAPYPSVITVSGLTGTISSVTVKLANLHHSNPDDLDVLLVNPAGQGVLLMSDVGGSSDLIATQLTFDDAAAATLPDSSPIASGTFKPTNVGIDENFPLPAPAGGYAATLSALVSTPANGAWTLYVLDDDHPRSGIIAGGWSLSFLACCAGQSNTPPSVSLSASPLTYVENSPNTIVDNAATVIDPDSADFAGGILAIEITANTSASDRLAIRNQGVAAGQIGTNGSSVTFAGVPFGTFSGGLSGADALTVNLSSAASISAVQALLRNISFGNISDQPSTEPRTIRFTLSDGDGGTSLPVTKMVHVTAINDSPALLPVANRTLDEGQTLVVTNIALDPDTPSAGLTFSIVSAPAGAQINPGNGLLTWTPGEGQGPATNVIFVSVSDDGAPSLAATQSFTVVVMEVNDPPMLSAIADRVVHSGMLVTFTNVAVDSDLPVNSMHYALSGAPAASSLDANTGVFTWTPSDADANTTNFLSISVTDNGVPPGVAVRSFSIAVLSAPVIETVGFSNGTVTLAWSSIPGRRYRVQFKTSLDDTSWTGLSGEVIASGVTATSLHTEQLSMQRFYRVEALP